MKLTLTKVKEIKKNANDKLTKEVCNYIINKWQDYDDKKHIFTDVLRYGCQSGIVGSLIYYSDTVAFYKRHRNSINNLLYKEMSACGLYSPLELFGDKWDKEDMLCIDTQNQNLLAWFGFEETLRNIARNFTQLENFI